MSEADQSGPDAPRGDLPTSRDALAERVDALTHELEQAHRDMISLAELGSLLHGCETLEDAHQVIGPALADMFAGTGGALYEYAPAEDQLELRTTWGGLKSAEVVSPADCWGLQLRVAHVVQAAAPSLSCKHVVRRTGDSICVPLFAYGDTVGLLHVMQPGGQEGPALSRAKRQLAPAVAEQIALTLVNLELRRKLQFEALRDPLTGLYNRRFADDWIEREVSRTDRADSSLGLVLVDVDRFKEVNDVHGHDAGDALLRAIAETFQASLRVGDVPCRYGGEEFLILLPDIELDHLVERAEGLRRQVAAVSVPHRGTTLPPVTVSAGVAVYPRHGHTAKEVVQAADQALYAAKRAGRNRTRTPT